MNSSTNSLIELIQEMIGVSRNLIDSCREERDALINADIQALQEASQSKNFLIGSLRQLELKRQQMFSIHNSKVKLDEFVLNLENSDLASANQLRKLKTTFKTLHEKVISMNQENQELILKSLGHLENMKKNVIGEAAPQSSTYGQSGSVSNPSPNPRWISTEA